MHILFQIVCSLLENPTIFLDFLTLTFQNEQSFWDIKEIKNWSNCLHWRLYLLTERHIIGFMNEVIVRLNYVLLAMRVTVLFCGSSM